MVSHIYKSLDEKDLGEDSDHTNEPSSSTWNRLRALIKQSSPGPSIAILVSIVLFGLATVSGFAVGKTAASRLVISDQPSPQPQAFFPNCAYRHALSCRLV
jgi:hypothetical protein